MTRAYAPAPGSDSEFDEIWRRAKEGLEAAGNPEGIGDEDAREKLAEAFVKHGGKSYETGTLSYDDIDQMGTTIEPVADRDLVIPAIPDEQYWWEDADEGRLMRHIVNLRLSLGRAVTGGIYITGPSGEGKTLGVVRMAAEMGLPFLKMDCAVISDAQRWFGARHVDKDRGDYYEESEFVQAVKAGTLILLDELPRLHASLWNAVMGFFGGNETVILSDLRVEIERSPKTMFIATANEGAAFSGNHRVDWALAERFPFRFERTPPPTSERIKVVSTHSGCDSDAAQVLVDVAEKTYSMWQTGDLRAPISTRTLIHAGVLIASGTTEREALAATAIGLYDGSADGGAGEKSERSQVRAIIEGRTKR